MRFRAIAETSWKILLLSCVVQVGCVEAQSAKRTPEGFKQLIPRGRIPAVNNPKYVKADKADVADDAFVLGVVIDGSPMAFSLNLLNRHEVVNDSVGKTNLAAIW